MIDPNTGVNMSLHSIKSPWGPNATQSGVGPGSLETTKIGGSNETSGQFANAIKNYLSEANDLQQSADMSITDLLSGKDEDIASVASAAARADVSFKLLVGVRNKLIEAYKQTMNMPL
ncbi:MAG: flagellar hook-basal body complex protein FliE [Sedimentisphaerales bacterium]|nr:flagellar hook-basal body complex protein FliE [Sedimentisphaerales bacterium]